MYESF
jgi:hypothetical protein